MGDAPARTWAEVMLGIDDVVDHCCVAPPESPHVEDLNVVYWITILPGDGRVDSFMPPTAMPALFTVVMHTPSGYAVTMLTAPVHHVPTNLVIYTTAGLARVAVVGSGLGVAAGVCAMPRLSMAAKTTAVSPFIFPSLQRSRR
jgi:hypothetical protein